MRILIVNDAIIPVKYYGGTERVIWYLAKELVKLGHKITFLVRKGSTCDFADVLSIDNSRDLIEQIPLSFDIVHFNVTPKNLENLKIPYVVTIHGSNNDDRLFDLNTIFVSKNHAKRYGSDSFVYNGLDWDDYSKPDWNLKRNYFHFLGNAAWRLKNVQGAIDIVKDTPSEKLKVLGGKRFNFSMGIRFTFSPRVSFYPSVGGVEKDKLLNQSKGLIFPVRWHEPFGLAIIESLYYGSPVFATPYGSIKELVTSEFGFLSTKKSDLVEAIQHFDNYSPQKCHEYVLENFNSKKMTLNYLRKYEKVLNGKHLNINPPQLQTIQQEKFLPWE